MAVHKDGYAPLGLETGQILESHQKAFLQLGKVPHGVWKTPSEFAFTLHPRRDLALCYAKGSAPAPVAPTPQLTTNSQGELRTG